jgi:hypothetical protein
MVNDNKHGLACIMCATTIVVVDTAVAASSMMAREESNDGTVRYDNNGCGDGGAVSSPSRSKPITAAAGTASSMLRVECNDSNDVTVRYDRGDNICGDRGAVSLPWAPSRTKAIATATATASSMARVVSNDGNDGNDGTVQYDPLYASSSSTLSATRTTLKREWSLADVKDTKKRLIGTSESARVSIMIYLMCYCSISYAAN